MTLGITEEHRTLSETVRSFGKRQDILRVARDQLDAPEESLPSFWSELAELGWLGLHLSEEVGGQGYGLPEVAVVLEELGRVVAPGPFLPSVFAAAVIDAFASEEVRSRWLPRLAAGTSVGAVGFGPLVLGAGLADVFVLAEGSDMVIVARDEVEVSPRRNLDLTRRGAQVVLRVEPGAGWWDRGHRH